MENMKDFMPKLIQKACPDCGSMCADTAKECWRCGFSFADNEVNEEYKLCKNCLSYNIMSAEMCWKCGHNEFDETDNAEEELSNEEVWIREKEIAQIGCNISLPAIVTAGDMVRTIKAKMEAHKLPHEIIKKAWISSGGVFHSNNTPCFVLRHPSHPRDWFGFCVVRRTMGDTAFVSVYAYGKSKMIKKENYLLNTRVFDGRATGNAVLGVLRGGSIGMGYAAGSLIGGAVRSGAKAISKGFSQLTMNYGALEQEKLWYDIVLMVFQQVFFGEENEQ